MIRTVLNAVLVSALLQTTAFAGPAEDGYSVVEQWAADFNAGNVDHLLTLFAPDALAWGTTARTLAKTPEDLAAYFAGLRTSGRQVELGEHSVVATTDDVVVAAGQYRFHGGTAGQAENPARFLFVVTNVGGEWKITGFNSSSMPPAPAAAPAAPAPVAAPR